MNKLKSIFAPPVFEDELKTQQAYLLNIIVWTLICVPIPFVIYAFFKTPENLSRAVMQGLFGETVNIILLIMLHRGYVRAASILQVSAFWLFFTVTAFTGTGVHGEAYMLGYGLVITIAGILLSGRGALTFTILSLLAGARMVYSEGHGFIQLDMANPPLTIWIVSLVLFPVSAVLQNLAARTVRTALARARVSEERYGLISRVSSNYIFSTEFNQQGDLHANWVAGAFKEITGYTFDEYLAGGGWRAHLHPDDLEKDDQNTATLMTNEPVVSEIRIIDKNGQARWVTLYAHPVWDQSQNRLTGIVGSVQDVTERKKVEQALRRSEAIYRQAIEVAGGVPYHQTFDEHGEIHYDFMSEGIREITGYGPEEFNDTLWGSLVQERQLLEDLENYSLDEAIQNVRSGKNPIWKCEHHIKARDGKFRWVFEAAVDLRDEHGIAYGSVGLYQDITERKQAEEALRYERDLLQIFMDNIPDQVYFKDAESRFVRINKSQASFLKLSDPQSAIGKTDHDFQTRELAQEFAEEEQRILATGEPVINRLEFNPTDKDKPRWLSTTKVPVRDSSGRAIGIIGISRDITQQKLANEREQQRRDLLERIVRLGQYVTEVQDVRSTLQRIWHSIRHQLNFDRLGIYLFDSVQNAMNGTYGTDNEGKMVNEWDVHLNLSDNTIETISFMTALQDPNGLYITHDYETEHDIPREGHIMSGVKDYGAVAAWAGDKPVAVICVDNHITGHPITEQQLDALRLFAGYAGLAIENARLHSALAAELEQQKEAEHLEQRRRALLEKVIQLGKRVTESTDLKTILDRIWHGVHDDLGFDRLGIFLYNRERNSMDSTLGTDIHGQKVDNYGIWFPIADWTSFKFLLEKPDGMVFTQNYAVENNIPEGHEMYGVKDYAAVAVWAGDKPVASIAVDQAITHRSISIEQLEALRLFAGYAGLAIENARLRSALENDLNDRKTLIEELEKKNAELERFTYTVSHDLKSPLVTITGFMGFLEQDASTGNIEKVKGTIKRINNAALKMQALLNDLLELSRIGRIINPPEDIAFVEIVHEAVERVRGRLDAINAVIEIKTDLPIVHGDRVRLVEVIQNLIENAAKYSSSHTIPRIEIGLTGQAPQKATFFVSDNGIGIAPEYHDNIFGLFNKLDATAEGTGIGLTLVKRIIEVHGGQIWVESDLGKGATFYFTLPTEPFKE